MKAIRWLCAFRARHTEPAEAIGWELNGHGGRDVAAELLFRGRSAMVSRGAANFGLGLEIEASTFRCGWLEDGWTETDSDGALRPKSVVRGKTFRDFDRLAAAFARSRNISGHAETVWARARYCALTVSERASARRRCEAESLAAQFRMPLVTIGGV